MITFGIGTTACEARPTPPASSPSSIAPTPEIDWATYDYPDGRCAPLYFDGPEMQTKAAKNCITAMNAGRVALVTFDIPREAATAVANGMESTIAEASKGLIDVTVEVVAATPAAKEEADQTMGMKGCVETQIGSLVSQAAERTMPTVLQNHDFVMALSQYTSCEPNVGGVADLSTDRHADVFGFEAGKKGEDRAISHASHELGHLYQLGHGGEVWVRTPDGSYSDLSIKLGKDVNLDTALVGSQYIVYGGESDGDIMGSMADVEHITPNPLALAVLQWPHVTLGKQPSPARAVGAAWTRLDVKAAKKDAFASVELTDPISLTVDDDVTHDFTKIGIVPVYNEYSGNVISKVTLYLSDGANNTARLGNVWLDSSKGTTTITTGGQAIDVRMNGKALSVRTRQS